MGVAPHHQPPHSSWCRGRRRAGCRWGAAHTDRHRRTHCHRQHSADAWLVLAYLALVPMFVGYVLFSRGLAGIDATTATTVTLVEPAVATVLAVLILDEHLGLIGWSGMALLGLALLILVAPGRR